jgi:hypothetical protein
VHRAKRISRLRLTDSSIKLHPPCSDFTLYPLDHLADVLGAALYALLLVRW